MPETAAVAERPGFVMNGGVGPCDAPLERAFAVVDAGLPPKTRSQGRLVVCAAEEIAPGERRIVEDRESGLSLGVFNVAGEFFAARNVCPHMGAPLCEGSLHGTHRPGDIFEFHPDLSGRVLRCPWHGWEFDVVTGKGLYDERSRVATYPCTVDENGDIVVAL